MGRKLLSIGQFLALVSGAATVGAAVYVGQDVRAVWGLLLVAFSVYMIVDPQTAHVVDTTDQWLPIKQGVAAVVGNTVLIVAAYLTKDPNVTLGLILVGLIERAFWSKKAEKDEEEEED